MLIYRRQEEAEVKKARAKLTFADDPVSMSTCLVPGPELSPAMMLILCSRASERHLLAAGPPGELCCCAIQREGQIVAQRPTQIALRGKLEKDIAFSAKFHSRIFCRLNLLLFHSPNACNSWALIKLKLRARNTVWDSHMHIGDPRPEPSPAASQNPQ